MLILIGDITLTLTIENSPSRRSFQLRHDVDSVWAIVIGWSLLKPRPSNSWLLTIPTLPCLSQQHPKTLATNQQLYVRFHYKFLILNHTQGSVVDPVNKAAKDADVDRKASFFSYILAHLTFKHQIRLYGVVEAFRRGRMPDNKQIDETLQYVIDNSPVDLDKISPDGQKLIQDTRDIIETARLMVQEKNADELFQNFVWHTRDIEFDRAKKDPNEVLPVDRQKATDDGQQGEYLKRIYATFFTLMLVYVFNQLSSTSAQSFHSSSPIPKSENSFQTSP